MLEGITMVDRAHVIVVALKIEFATGYAMIIPARFALGAIVIGEALDAKVFAPHTTHQRLMARRRTGNALSVHTGFRETDVVDAIRVVQTFHQLHRALVQPEFKGDEIGDTELKLDVAVNKGS